MAVYLALVLIAIGIAAEIYISIQVLRQTKYHPPDAEVKAPIEAQPSRDPDAEITKERDSNQERLFTEGVYNVLNYDIDVAKKAYRGE